MSIWLFNCFALEFWHCVFTKYALGFYQRKFQTGTKVAFVLFHNLGYLHTKLHSNQFSIFCMKE